MGIAWLAAVWTVALLAPRIVPWMSGTNPWTWDVVRRVTPLTRWDSGWYLNLAEAGYWEPPTRVGQETNHAFFPLYPGLMRLLVRTTGIETSRAGNLVSAAAFLAALLLFAEWTRRHFGEERVGPAVLVLLAFPTPSSSPPCTRSPSPWRFALAAVLVERGRTFTGAAAGVLAGLTRISGSSSPVPRARLVAGEPEAGLPRPGALAGRRGRGAARGLRPFCSISARFEIPPLRQGAAQLERQAKSILTAPR